MNTHRGLIDMVYQFLEHMQWEREKSELARKVSLAVYTYVLCNSFNDVV